MLFRSEVEFEGYVADFVSVTEFSVNGQLVSTDANTEFENGSSETLANDVFVEVEGILTESGVVLAEEIEFKQQKQVELEVKGEISEFVSATDFMLNGHKITTTDTTEYENGNVEKLAEGVYAEVKGMLNADNILVADNVKFEEMVFKDVEGAITAFTSATQFSVMGQAVITTDATEFENNDSSMLALDKVVQVEGYVNADGIIVAEKVSYKDEETSTLEGTIEADLVDNSFSINSVTVKLQESTEFNNGDITALKKDVDVEVEGKVVEGVLIADKVDIKD